MGYEVSGKTVREPTAIPPQKPGEKASAPAAVRVTVRAHARAAPVMNRTMLSSWRPERAHMWITRAAAGWIG